MVDTRYLVRILRALQTVPKCLVLISTVSRVGGFIKLSGGARTAVSLPQVGITPASTQLWLPFASPGIRPHPTRELQEQ